MCARGANESCFFEILGFFQELGRATVHSQVYTWGTNDYGQLGNGTTNYDTLPRKVVDMDGVQVRLCHSIPVYIYVCVCVGIYQ